MDKTALKTAAAEYGTPLYLFDLDAFTARAEKCAPRSALTCSFATP